MRSSPSPPSASPSPGHARCVAPAPGAAAGRGADAVHAVRHPDGVHALPRPVSLAGDLYVGGRPHFWCVLSLERCSLQRGPRPTPRTRRPRGAAHRGVPLGPDAVPAGQARPIPGRCVNLWRGEAVGPADGPALGAGGLLVAVAAQFVYAWSLWAGQALGDRGCDRGIALLLATVSFWVMDCANNVLQLPARVRARRRTPCRPSSPSRGPAPITQAVVADLASEDQQELGQALVSLWSAVGSVAAFAVAALIDPVGRIRGYFGLASALLVCSCTATIVVAVRAEKGEPAPSRGDSPRDDPERATLLGRGSVNAQPEPSDGGREEGEARRPQSPAQDSAARLLTESWPRPPHGRRSVPRLRPGAAVDRTQPAALHARSVRGAVSGVGGVVLLHAGGSRPHFPAPSCPYALTHTHTPLRGPGRTGVRGWARRYSTVRCSAQAAAWVYRAPNLPHQSGAHLPPALGGGADRRPPPGSGRVPRCRATCHHVRELDSCRHPLCRPVHRGNAEVCVCDARPKREAGGGG